MTASSSDGCIIVIAMWYSRDSVWSRRSIGVLEMRWMGSRWVSKVEFFQVIILNMIWNGG